MARREQRAAVLIGNDRDRIGAEPLRLGDDLFLVHADQRPEDRQRRHRSDRRQVLERLRRDLADDLAGHQRARARVARDAARRSAASAADRRRRAVGPARRADLLLNLAERHEIAAASAAASASAAPPARAPSPATRATESDSCESGRACTGSRASSCGTPQPASRCRPTAGTTTRPPVPVGSRPAPALLAEEVERLDPSAARGGSSAPASSRFTASRAPP